MVERFATREEFLSALEGRLERSGLSLEWRRKVAESMALVDEGDTTNPATAFELRIGRWFLRDDDLPFFEMLGAVGPLVLTALGPAALDAPALAGAAAAVLGSAWRMWRKSGRLTPETMAVLAVLQAAGPMREQDLADALTASGVVADAAKTRELLDQLKDVELNDGSSAALVRRNAEGLWRVVDV